MSQPAHHKVLDQETLDLINNIKEFERKLLVSMDILRDDTSVEQRWLQIARTQFEQGFMAYIRAVANPDA